MKFDVHQTRELLDKAIAERGADYVYEPPQDDEGNREGDCAYFHHEDEGVVPGCIVGHAFSYVGIGHHDVVEGEYAYGDSHSAKVRAKFDTSSLHFLTRVQKHQDDDTPWGAAVRRAVDEQ